MIGRVTPEGVVTEFSSGITFASEPLDITAGPDGNLWFTERDGRSGALLPTGVVTEFSIGITPGSEPREHHGGAGRQPVVHRARRQDRADHSRRRRDRVLRSASPPGANRARSRPGPDGNLWFTELVRDQDRADHSRRRRDRVLPRHHPRQPPGRHHGRAGRQPVVHRGRRPDWAADGRTGDSQPGGPPGSGSTGPTYYVSTSGSDSNPGTLTAPWRTVSHAASAAGAGATVLIEAGSYAEDVKLTVSGAPGSPITLRATAQKR